HDNDKSETLKILGTWLCNVVAKTNNDAFKDRLLTEAAPLLRVFQKSESNTAIEPTTTIEPTNSKPATLRPLVIRTILKTNDMLPARTPMAVTTENARELGESIARSVIDSRDR
ncbi:249_t:CDS:1, partial [Paraglomus occultum]